MSDLIIHNSKIADRLREIAERDNRSVEDVIANLLEQFELQHTDTPDPNETEVPPRSLAAFEKVAREMRFKTDQSDISERSREILNTEYAQYLLDRMNLEGNSTY